MTITNGNWRDTRLTSGQISNKDEQRRKMIGNENGVGRYQVCVRADKETFVARFSLTLSCFIGSQHHTVSSVFTQKYWAEGIFKIDLIATQKDIQKKFSEHFPILPDLTNIIFEYYVELDTRKRPCTPYQPKNRPTAR